MKRIIATTVVLTAIVGVVALIFVAVYIVMQWMKPYTGEVTPLICWAALGVTSLWTFIYRELKRR